jgi:hypothetical protein
MAASIALLPSAQLWSKHRFLLDAPWDHRYPFPPAESESESVGKRSDQAATARIPGGRGQRVGSARLARHRKG